jgi:glycosyltransferase involved in cell wall biosynthesis
LRRVLLFSFYYPPCNGTPAPRPYSWARVFARRGYKVTVVTRHWKDSDNTWEDYINSTEERDARIIEEEGVKVIFLPYTKKTYSSNSIIAKISVLANLTLGYLEPEANTFQFKKRIEQELEAVTYDLIITTAPPWNSARLAAELSEKYKIPCVIDFRDYENDMTLNLKPTPNLQRRIEFFFDKFYMKQWIKKARLVTVASYAIGDYIAKQNGIQCLEILNGYDSEIVDISNNTSIEPSEKFTITVLGYLYPAQNLNVLFEGFKKFLEINPSPQLAFQFIGQMAIPDVADNIISNMPPEYITLTKRVSFNKSLDIGLKSDLLFYIGWTNWVGVYSAKITTYLALKRNILIAPGDNDIIDKVISDTNSGKIANTADEFCQYLSTWYTEWQITRQLTYKGDLKKIETYSRDNQAHKLIDKIESDIFKTQSSKVESENATSSTNKNT